MITITANGKDYLVSERLFAYDTLRDGVVFATQYFSTRNGERFGSVRFASSLDKPKSVGSQLIAQLSSTLNADTAAMIAEADRLTVEFKASGRNGAYPTVALITK